jgi:aminoglycoside phosphotransferase (APT) family kinase protein
MAEQVAGTVRVGVADPQDVVRRAGVAIGEELTDLDVLPGGRSSQTYRVCTASGVPVVVKVAPPGLEPVRNRDVLRQARVLTALAAADGVAVPAVLGTEPGTPPDVPPLFVMSFAEGESYEPRQSHGGPRPEPEVVLARGRAAAEMLAALHAPAPADLGIDETDAGLAAEVERWRKALATCPLTPEQERTAKRTHDRLLETLPVPVRASVLHGDWRLGNMQCVGPEIRAVIDWEIWSVGDGRLDLAWMRNMHDPKRPTADAPDAPSLEPDELAQVYAAAGGHVADLAWFDALVRYKQAAASALLVKNADKRGEASPQIEGMRDGVGLLLDAALVRLS